MSDAVSAGLAAVRAELRALADPARAAGASRFFKTGPGEYGEGDRFLGLTVPQIRSVVRAHRATQVDDALALLDSPWHEERLCAVLLLVEAHARGDERARQAVLDAYLARAATHVNNWDLVDASAEYLVGEYLLDGDTGGEPLLDELAASDSLWERRVAVLGTFAFTKGGDGGPILRLADRKSVV